MTTGTDATAPRVLDNNSLADTLITLAGLLRLNPQLPPVSSIHVNVGDYQAGTWEASVHPAVYSDEEESIDAVRTFAAVFGTDATLHLELPQTSSLGGTYRRLATRAVRAGLQMEAWAFIDRIHIAGQD
jgi:hypothetical protein